VRAFPEGADRNEYLSKEGREKLCVRRMRQSLFSDAAKVWKVLEQSQRSRDYRRHRKFENPGGKKSPEGPPNKLKPENTSRLFGTDGIRGEAGKFPPRFATRSDHRRSLAIHLAERTGRQPSNRPPAATTRIPGRESKQALIAGARHSRRRSSVSRNHHYAGHCFSYAQF